MTYKEQLNMLYIFLWGMKDPNYVMRMMTTGGPLLAYDTCKETVIRWKENGEYMVKKFKYKLPFDLNFRYRYAVYDHNNLKHALPLTEDTWMTYCWECRIFAFNLAISEVNEFLILHYVVYCGLCQEGMNTLVYLFRKLAWQPINNIYIGELGGGGLNSYHNPFIAKERKKILEPEVDLHCKNSLSTVQLQL